MFYIIHCSDEYLAILSRYIYSNKSTFLLKLRPILSSCEYYSYKKMPLGETIPRKCTGAHRHGSTVLLKQLPLRTTSNLKLPEFEYNILRIT